MITTEQDKSIEVKHIKKVLRANGYQNWVFDQLENPKNNKRQPKSQLHQPPEPTHRRTRLRPSRAHHVGNIRRSSLLACTPRQVMAGARLAVRCGAKSKLLGTFALNKGETALHLAAHLGHAALCEQLLEAKADPCARMALWGMTPLEGARWWLSGKRRGGRAGAPIEALLGGGSA